jgi:UDP-N-acetylmuramoyl-tripeptide--D-alanyl-D-alanine ligase
VEVDGIRIHTNLVGNYNFENVLAAVCIGKHFDVPMEDIKAAIESYVPSNNRSQQLQWGNNTVIMDAYNANPSSMQQALKNFDQLSAENKVTILGEMMELGEYAAEEHRRIKELTDVMDLKQRVFTGGGFAFLKDDPSVLYFENTELLKDWFINRHFEDSYILVKGSRKNELEKLVKG